MSNYRVDLSGHNALVTGGGAGRGRTIALALAASGASVAIGDINIERAEDTAEQIERLGGSAIALHVDVSNRFQTANMIESARDAFGMIGILINAAEVYHPEPMLTIDEWNWRRQLEVNITGTFFCMQLVGRVMADEGGGTIINLTSVEAWRSTIPAGIGYMAGKAGVIAMTRQAARELAPHQIRVNAIAVRKLNEDEGLPPLPEDPPPQRIGCPDELSGAALFLCSDAARSISGQVLVIDGGRSIV